jgi:hypothetical protein
MVEILIGAVLGTVTSIVIIYSRRSAAAGNRIVGEA